MKVLLVGNYEFDGSTSMRIWSGALHRELVRRGIDAQLLSPKPFFGRIKPSAHGLGKWLGYIDRFVIFPGRLRAAAAGTDLVHICDHGSAMFSFQVRNKPVIVTCHDMLAVRGALGEIPEMRPSLAGRLLQRWIRRGIARATQAACVSQFTLEDTRRILNSDRNLCKVLNGLNYPFHPLDAGETARRLAPLPGLDRPFILHVGSGHVRKNRLGVLRVFANTVKQTDLRLVFAGKPLGGELEDLARELGVRDRVIPVVEPDVETIEALYNRAVALLFPSLYEGFGWPPIEAQASGCPVVASDIPPLAEILGDSAAIHSVADEAGMADSIVRLADGGAFREQMRQRGFENVHSRFQTARMMDDYLALYQELVVGTERHQIA